MADSSYHSDADIIAIGEGLLNRTLPKEQWTHEAHIAAALYFMVKKPNMDLPQELPDIIRAYNEATNTPNTDTGGYHETITQFYIQLIGIFLKTQDQSLGLLDLHKRFMKSPLSHKDYPLTFYSREKLFSITARKIWVESDIKTLA